MMGDAANNEEYLGEAVYKEQTIKCSYFWTIKNFKNRKERFLYSDVFKIHEPDGRITRWKLQLYPRGDEMAEDGDMSFYLNPFNSFDDVKLSFECSIWDDTTKTKQNSIKITDKLFTKKIGFGWGMTMFCTAGVIQDHPEWFSDGNLKIVCDINLPSERSTSKDMSVYT